MVSQEKINELIQENNKAINCLVSGESAYEDLTDKANICYINYESLRDLDITGNLALSTFYNTTITNVTFHDCDMRFVKFVNCIFDNVNFIGVDLSGSEFFRCKGYEDIHMITVKNKLSDIDYEYFHLNKDEE